MRKNDLLTGEEFETNRVNQNFANAQNRVKYYKNKAQELRRKTARINKPLHKNLRILNELLPNKGEIIKHKQFLLGKGYLLSVFTHFEKYGEKSYPSLYEYTIIRLENEHIKIIKK